MFAQKVKKQIITLFNDAVAVMYDAFNIIFAPKKEYVPIPVRVKNRR